ncbi:MAG TPA: ABC transporter permease [Candidatus Atribacteria bacterium]|uniref:Inner-membrane translocator n=1 Tax=candidate division TA06 bacterium 34_109 TaxID=1635277 RepID=A0A117M634_UNCT6|nr:MAG: Inner-membrane translocator [candidate division TA06 bacterium 34_109]HBY57214.1 ABC transporter permease [Candidatus Atribacteria bacterium]
MTTFLSSLKRLFIAILFALILAVVIIIITSSEPSEAIKVFFLGPFSNKYFLGNMVSYAIPLIISGLGASIAFSADMWNMGLEGQLYIGSLCGTYLAYQMSSCPKTIVVPIVLMVSFFIGGGSAAISSYLKNRWKINVFLSSLLIANALFPFVTFFLEGPFSDPKAGMAASPYFNRNFMFSKILPPSELHSGLLISLGLVILFYFIMKRRVLGYEIKMTGENALFAYYGGVPTARIEMIAMFLSGGLAGLAGMINIFGSTGRMLGYMTNFGWNGIPIAIIARYDPIIVVPAALLFSFVQKGAEAGALFADITPEIAQLIQATIFYIITAEGLFEAIGIWKRKSSA